MSKRKFYRVVTTVTWLSDVPPNEAYDGSLAGLGEALDTGDGVMDRYEEVSAEVAPRAMAKMLIRAGSDPAFFGLSENGTPLEESSE